MSAWTLTRHGDLYELSFDVPDEKVNVLRSDNMEELEQRLDELAGVDGIQGLMVTSAKRRCFIAGADIHAIRNVKDEAEGEAAAKSGQDVFAKLEALPFPTVAVIHGACVGGGLELALACRYRVASDDSSTRLGLPEVMLGILPGFGGTQRLPRLLGLIPALPLLLTGKMLDGRRARRVGLVDAVGPAELLKDIAQTCMRQGVRRKRGMLNGMVRLLPWLRGRVLAKARAQVAKKTGGQYPAPFAILDCADAAFRGSKDRGFALEAKRLGELIVSKPSRNLVRLFVLAEQAREVECDAREVERAFVAGAGTMGAGIVALMAGQGVRVRMMDPMAEALQHGVKTVRDLLRKKTRRHAKPKHELGRLLDLLEPTTDTTGLIHQDLFLEVVPERLDLKQKVLGLAENELGSEAMLATNTSSLDLDDISQGLKNPERLVGIHFFNPVHRMRLVEIVRSERTGQEWVTRATALVRQLGKVPVVVKSAPGFLVNRLLTPYLLEAERLASEGAAIETLDRLACKAGMPMGPFALLDEVGLDVAGHVSKTLCDAFPDRFETAGLVQRLVDAGELGKKSGRGFFIYGKERSVNARVAGGSTSPSPDQVEEWQQRMILPVVAEALRCLEEGIASSADDIDLAMMLGAGLLLPFGGPMQWARDRGWGEIANQLSALNSKHGARFATPKLLNEWATNDEPAPVPSP